MDFVTVLAQLGPATFAGNFIGLALKVILYLALIVSACCIGAKLKQTRMLKKAEESEKEGVSAVENNI